LEEYFRLSHFTASHWRINRENGRSDRSEGDGKISAANEGQQISAIHS